MIISSKILKIINEALEEDMPFGDITSDNIFNDEYGEAKLIAKEKGIISGIYVAEAVFKAIDKETTVDVLIKDGSEVDSGDIIAKIKGKTKSLLKAERTALNLLQRMSGIATKTFKLTSIVEDYNVKVTDTRKTTPGLRILEKYSVLQGGGYNHRFSLSDGAMIKDNHIKALGSIKKSVEIMREKIPHTIKIEVETENMREVKEALEAGADIIMLDNMSIEKIREAVKYIGEKAIVEASGNITEKTILDIANTGVDIISVGSLTHSFDSMDISMKFE